MITRDYYRILQIDPTAEPEVIEVAYKRLARKYHPDFNQASNALFLMQEINEAYEVLGDFNKRVQYDKERVEDKARRQRRVQAEGLQRTVEAKRQKFWMIWLLYHTMLTFAILIIVFVIDKTPSINITKLVLTSIVALLVEYGTLKDVQFRHSGLLATFNVLLCFISWSFLIFAASNRQVNNPSLVIYWSALFICGFYVWFVLNKRIQRANWWITSTFVGSFIGYKVAWHYWVNPFSKLDNTNIITFLIMSWLIYAAITGFGVTICVQCKENNKRIMPNFEMDQA
jgi:hypothetical protein